MKLIDRAQHIVDGLDTGNVTDELRNDAQRLVEDLRVSGAGEIEVVADVDGQPPVVTNFAPEDAQG